MPLEFEDELLPYYERELTYLRRMGAAFAERFPKVAGRLELGTDYCPDPTIERMIESFAFLTGRLQHNIDSQFPEISSALLGILYPHFLAPVPSMTIAQFQPDPDQVKLTEGHVIKKNTQLTVKALSPETGNPIDELVRFRTCYPVTLWPVQVSYAGFESTDQFDLQAMLRDPGDADPAKVATVLKLTIESTEDSFAEANLSSLRFFLNGEGTLPLALYQMLFSNVLKVVLIPDNGSPPIRLSKDVLTPVGFGEDEDVLPWHPVAHPAYRLLQEYFTFHDKFLFFEIDRLDTHSSDAKFDIVFLLDERPKHNLAVDADHFRLGCTPIINLFRKTTEPIRWDHRQTEYRLNPDVRRERSTEIHTVLKVTSTSNPTLETQNFEPFYSYTHEMESGEHGAFWYARRDLTGKKNLPGTETFLTFLNLDFHPTQPPVDTIYAHTLCTNRDLAEQLPDGALLQIEEAAPITRITCLKKPTRELLPTLSGEAQWKLISHLSLNHLSLTSGEEGLKSLQEILLLYSFSNRLSTSQQITGIRDMQCRRIFRRVGREAWRGFCRGIEITLTFNESMYAGNNAFLFATVLNRFFPLYSSINTFTQLIIKSEQREGIWKKWQPLAGEQIVL